MSIHEEIKQSKGLIYQDEDIIVALDIDPISIGHVLILPQGAYLDLDDLPTKVLNKINRCAQLYIRLLRAKFSPLGYSMMQNGGLFNDIGVFHMHLFPRFKREEFGFQHTKASRQMPDQASFKTAFAHELANKMPADK